MYLRKVRKVRFGICIIQELYINEKINTSERVENFQRIFFDRYFEMHSLLQFICIIYIHNTISLLTRVARVAQTNMKQHFSTVNT